MYTSNCNLTHACGVQWAFEPFVFTCCSAQAEKGYDIDILVQAIWAKKLYLYQL